MVDEQKNEGHSREWQDRARVVLNEKEAVKTEASPNQSPVPGTDNEDVEEKSPEIGKKEDKDQAY